VTVGVPTRQKIKKILKKICIFCGIGILASLGLLMVLWLLSPDVTVLKKQNPKTTAMMGHREAQYLKKTGKRLWRSQTWMPLSRISPKLIQAVVIAEDDRFFQHGGFDLEGMKEAFEKNLEQGHIVGGGSTIIQQLAKNLYLNPARNPIRKIREAVIAFELNRRLRKGRILELYLNVIEWGRGIYGAEAAARSYYGKPAAELNAEEAIRLASVLPNPSRYFPEDDRYYRMRKKRRTVAAIMVKRQLMTDEEYRMLLSDLDQKGRSQ
jgi:monofunctional biosynthetic peptidoglycan transglycosylase